MVQAQAAGHAHTFFKVAPDSPWVYKAMFPKELRFNRALFESDEKPWTDASFVDAIDPVQLATDLASLRRFVPEFKGEKTCR